MQDIRLFYEKLAPYGDWVRLEPYGWVWVPVTVWAPDWAAWQMGNGWLGWAPLPPGVTWGPKVGLSADRLDLAALKPLSYIFVPVQQFLEPELQRYVVLPARNVTLLPLTQNVTSYIPVEGQAHNRSLSIEQVAQIPSVRVTPASKPTPPYR